VQLGQREQQDHKDQQETTEQLVQLAVTRYILLAKAMAEVLFFMYTMVGNTA
jgi:hypothetical protein